MILSRNQQEIKSRVRTKSKMLDNRSHHGAILRDNGLQPGPNFGPDYELSGLGLGSTVDYYYISHK